jgi:predicted O-methyltransferase YrrM
LPAPVVAALVGLRRRWRGEPRFYESHDQGQMVERERALVHRTVLERRARLCVEMGTWRGGGSTYQIARALAENGGGMLYTFEPDPELFQVAVGHYRRQAPELLPYVSFHCEDFLAGVQGRDLRPIEFAVLDGPDDPAITRSAVALLEERLAPGAFVILHDWNIEKCRQARPYLEGSSAWRIDTVYADTPTGLARVQRLTTPTAVVDK